MIRIENQTKYEFIKEVTFTIIEMYSIHNKGKSVVAERFIRTLKTEIYKYMTSVSKNMYIDKLDDIVSIIIHTIEQLR